MKRILEGSRILYVQRHRGWSLLLLLAGAVLLALAPVAWRKRDWGFAAVLTAGALTCFVAASAYLVESRVLLIDRAAGRARVLTRA